MGITNLFGVPQTGFSDDTPMIFDDMIHKAKIEIDENGSVAAAASATMSRSMTFFESEPIKFHCDHPFVFMINDRVSQEILFAGVYRGPGNWIHLNSNDFFVVVVVETQVLFEYKNRWNKEYGAKSRIFLFKLRYLLRCLDRLLIWWYKTHTYVNIITKIKSMLHKLNQMTVNIFFTNKLRALKHIVQKCFHYFKFL